MSTKKKMPIKKIAISTGGGDAPGLNAVIRAAALSAHHTRLGSVRCQGWLSWAIIT